MSKDRPKAEPRKPPGWKKPGKRKQPEQPVKNDTKIIFRAKSPWQKDDCKFCTNKATLEAVSRTHAIRCCKNDGCKEQAKAAAALANGKH